MVTTDGHRLSKVERKHDRAMLNFSMLVPNKGVGELKRLIDDAKSANKASAKSDGDERLPRSRSRPPEATRSFAEAM